MLSNPFLKYLTTVNLLLLLVVSSCNIINPDEDQPAYVKIEPFTFDPLPASGFGRLSPELGALRLMR